MFNLIDCGCCTDRQNKTKMSEHLYLVKEIFTHLIPPNVCMEQLFLLDMESHKTTFSCENLVITGLQHKHFRNRSIFPHKHSEALVL